MAKNHYLNHPPDETIDRAPRDTIRREFSKRLQALLRERGWNQSELARRLYGTTKDSAGRVVAKGRDNVSGWVRGKVLPYDDAMDKLCNVLGVDRDALVPYELSPNTDRDIPPFEAKELGQDRIWLRINQQISKAQFKAIMAVIYGTNGR